MCASRQTLMSTFPYSWTIDPGLMSRRGKGRIWQVQDQVRRTGQIRVMGLNNMITGYRFTYGATAATLLLVLSGCAGMSDRDKNTAIGAGVGAVGGAVITGGSAVGTVGGAAVGGVIGHEIDD